MHIELKTPNLRTIRRRICRPPSRALPRPPPNFTACYDNLLSEHIDEARELGKHPFETPGWQPLSEGIPRLLRRDDLADEIREGLTRLSDTYEQWQNDRAVDRRIDFQETHAPPTKPAPTSLPLKQSPSGYRPPAEPRPPHLPAPASPPRSSAAARSPTGADLYANYRQRLQDHDAKAKSIDKDLFDTPGWVSLAKEIPGLLQRNDLSREAHDFLTRLSESSDRWTERQKAQQAGKTQKRPSRGMSF